MESLDYIIKMGAGIGVLLFFIMVGVIMIINIVRRWIK
jgi:hypothetical protein